MHIVNLKKQQKGISIIEVMVSTFIMAIGVLGVASLQISSLKMNQGAYHQSQANILMTEILDRMRLNRTAFLSENYDGVNTADDAPAEQACIVAAGGCTGEQLALQDIRDFKGFFNDVNALGNDFIPFIPGGSATISRDTTTNMATVVVSWEQEEWSEVGGKMVKNMTDQQLSISVQI